MKFKPYISVDLETTGLPNEEGTQILQLAAVYEDFTLPIDEQPSLNVIIDNGDDLRGNPYALLLNAGLLQAITESRRGVKVPVPVVSLDEAKHLWSQFTRTAAMELKGNIQLAGKNVQGFDRLFLEKYGFHLDHIQHRVIDPGPMFFGDFGYVPSLEEISRRLNLGPVSHDALDDARRVIEIVRMKAGILVHG